MNMNADKYKLSKQNEKKGIYIEKIYLLIEWLLNKYKEEGNKEKDGYKMVPSSP